MNAALEDAAVLRVGNGTKVQSSKIIVILPEKQNAGAKSRLLLSCGEWVPSTVTAQTLKNRLETPSLMQLAQTVAPE